jgi:hypothetical protein
LGQFPIPLKNVNRGFAHTNIVENSPFEVSAESVTVPSADVTTGAPRVRVMARKFVIKMNPERGARWDGVAGSYARTRADKKDDATIFHELLFWVLYCNRSDAVATHRVM